MKVNFKGTDIHYTVDGNGPALVLLHGFLESSRIWDPFIPTFSRYRKVICIDLPGHGQSGVVEEVHSMELMAEAVATVLRELNISTIDFIGHSMGGYVGLALMETTSEIFRSFMLLNSTPLADTKEKKAIRERSVDLVRKNKDAYISMAISNLLTSTNLKVFAQEISLIKEEAYGFPVSGITAALEGMKQRKDRTHILQDFSGTKVIVAGTEDPLIELSEIRKIAEDTKCRFFSFPGGHLSYIENSEEFLKLCISSKNLTG